MKLRGFVCSGLGRAHIFMAQPHYQNQFENLLGYTAWPGTLNVKVDEDSLEKYVALRTKSGVSSTGLNTLVLEKSESINLGDVHAKKIDGFERDGSSFGGATAFVAQINSDSGRKVDCAILIPDLTRHVDVVEIISNHFLREKLELENGDYVEILLFEN